MSDLFLHAHIAGQAVAIPTASIDSVIALDVVVPVPSAPPWVRGLSALRSRVVTVVDPALLLGSVGTGGDRAVVVMVEGHLYALLVDALHDVAPGVEEPPLAGGQPAWTDPVRGMVQHENRSVAVLEPARLIPQPLAAA